MEHVDRTTLAAIAFALTIADCQPALCADTADFSKGVTFQSDIVVDFGINPDKKAFTAIFAGLEAKIVTKSSPPIVTRTYSFVMPLSGVKPTTAFPIYLQGYIFNQQGANGHLIFTVNDQTTVADFTEPSDRSFLQQIDFKPGTASDLRVTIVLIADRDSATDAAVNLSVTAVDSDTEKHKKK